MVKRWRAGVRSPKKLAERDDRHKRMGDSQEVVEPVKEGAKAACAIFRRFLDRQICGTGSTTWPDRSRRACLPRRNWKQFQKAESCGRCCHLHDTSPNEEDRNTFDLRLKWRSVRTFTPYRAVRR